MKIKDVFSRERDSIHISILSLTQDWNEETSTLLQYVSKERREKVNKYLRNEDKMLSLYAALLCRMQVSQYTHITNEELFFLCTNNNKPILLSDVRCYFNISHAGNRVLLAVSSEPIGVDVEKLTDISLDIMDVVFHKEEIAYVRNGITDVEQDMRFYKIWTQKEALLKQMGVGLGEKAVLINTLSKKYRDRYIVKYEEDYIYTVCTTKLKKIHCVRLNEDEISSYFSKILPDVKEESYF